MLNVIMLSVVKLNVVMLNVVAPFHLQAKLGIYPDGKVPLKAPLVFKD